jgi:ubiE/COQ5 methyltransferase family
MPGGDEIGDVQRAAWAGLSAGWEKWDPVIMDQLGPVGTAITGRLGIAGDQQHLDIAAGTGEPGLTVARLAPGGHVVPTDLAAEMLDIATRRANAQGITNIEGSSPASGNGKSSSSRASTASGDGATAQSASPCR